MKVEQNVVIFRLKHFSSLKINEFINVAEIDDSRKYGKGSLFCDG